MKQPPVTILTVCNPRYRDRLARNWPLWQAMRGISRCSYIILAVDKPNLSFISTSRRVHVIPYEPPIEADTDRERCLSAFVFGAAQHVRTPYWMKLDCDSTPKRGRFDWPDYENYSVVAHRCSYTKVKGEPFMPGDHWLNRLDRWWLGTHGTVPTGQFPIIETQRHYHPRYASFCAIYATWFTHHVAELCGARLPVPSEDTTTWYVSNRASLKVKIQNMKRWFSPGR